MKLPGVSPAVLAATLALSWDSHAPAQTWTAVGPPGSPFITALLVDPGAPTTVYAGTLQDGVFVTTDAGATWSRVNTGLTSLSVTSFAAFRPSTPSAPPVLCAGTNGGGVFRSSDRGSTWVAVNNGLSNLGVTSLVVADSTATVYAGTLGGGVFRSTDDGETWSPLNAGLTNQYIVSLSVDPSNSSVLLAGTYGSQPWSGSLFRTIDGGAHWSLILSYVKVWEIAWDPFFAETLYVGYGNDSPARLFGGLLKSTDGGEHWWPADTGLLHQIIHMIAVDTTAPGHVYAAPPFGGLYVTSNFGASWSLAPSDGLPAANSNNTISFAPTSPPVAYLGTDHGLFRAVPQPLGACTPDAMTLCLQSNRFRVEVGWKVSAQGVNLGQVSSITSNTGAFWFFDPTNLELVVKVLDGRSINGKFWVFYGSLTNVEFTLTVTDTQTGAVKTYVNPQGQLASVADTSAF